MYYRIKKLMAVFKSIQFAGEGTKAASLPHIEPASGTSRSTGGVRKTYKTQQKFQFAGKNINSN